MDTRKVEAFLLRTYNARAKVELPRMTHSFGEKMDALSQDINTPGVMDTFESHLLRMTKTGALFAMLFYILFWGVILFDSWDSFASLALRENIDTNLVLLASFLIPICMFAVILPIRLQILKTDGASLSNSNSTALGAARNHLSWKIHFVVIPVGITMMRTVFMRDPDREPMSTAIVLLIFSVMFLLGTVAGLYNLYLLRKYCPYLAHYCGGEIKRP